MAQAVFSTKCAENGALQYPWRRGVGARTSYGAKDGFVCPAPFTQGTAR